MEELPGILLLEDDYKMASELRHFLNRSGFTCDAVYDGVLFFKHLATAPFQLYILDINVPLINGLEVCRKVRLTDPSTPILMLTAYGAVEDKVESLEAGADDYLVKPFHFEELLARIKALLRRSASPQKEQSPIYEVADLVIEVANMRVTRGGVEINLTPKEYRLLELLASARGRIISKQTIAEQVWDINFETGTNTIEVYISFLRNKIDKEFDVKLLHTKPGYGYFLKKLT